MPYVLYERGYFIRMKKSFFILSFNGEVFLLILSLIFGGFSLLFHTLTSVFGVFNSFYNVMLVIWLLITTIAVTVLCIEIVDRCQNDSVSNLFWSIWKTFQLRHFLKNGLNNQVLLSEDILLQPLIHDQRINKLITNSYVDVRNRQIAIWIKLPLSFEMQRFIENNLDLITKHIQARNQFYIFSTFQRNRRYLLLVGTKR